MESTKLHYALILRIYGKEKCFGPGIADLLERVDRLKSLRKAAIEMDMAYSKAWKIMKTAEANLGFPLLSSSTGGRGGGGASLTEPGRQFLESYRRFEEAVRNFADEAFLEIMGNQEAE